MLEMNKKSLLTWIQNWLDEDIANGDITSLSVIPSSHRSDAIIHAKQAGIVAGLEVVRLVFLTVDETLQVDLLINDGEEINAGQHMIKITGSTRSILQAERLALNLLQHLSGIATKTEQFVRAIHGLPTRVVDTRKTTPGLRMLQKYAVRVGGGHNHRFGLYDAVMIKDNHIKAAGSIHAAIGAARNYVPHTTKIEVEIEQLSQIEEALEADIIMLDNMPPKIMKQAVQQIRNADKKIIIEASGNVTLTTIQEIALTGVDVISVGELTHSVQALDISLDLYEQKESAK
jgi:nicotinate-nucleotide pyrophosphorylase (carboxylating)